MLGDMGKKRCGDLAVILQLACLTEDRSDQEQRALLRVARAVDTEVNRLISSNKAMWHEDYRNRTVTRLLPESRLEQLVHVTRVLGDKDHEVSLPKKKGKPPAQQLPEGWRLVDA